MRGARRGNLCAAGLLELHVVFDGLHAIDGTRHFHGRSDVLARGHEAAQLNDALECLDIDLGDLQARLAQDGGLDFGSDDAVVDVLTGTFLRACRRTAYSRHEYDGREDRAESLDGMHGMNSEVSAREIA